MACYNSKTQSSLPSKYCIVSVILSISPFYFLNLFLSSLVLLFHFLFSVCVIVAIGNDGVDVVSLSPMNKNVTIFIWNFISR